MTKKELIEGGWIDKYVLGLTSEEESSEVERLASLYPEIQHEINQSRNRLCGKFNRNLTRPALRHSLLTKKRVLWGSAMIVSVVLAGFLFMFREHLSLKANYNYQCQKLAQQEAQVHKLSSFSKAFSDRAHFLNSSTTQRIKLKGCESSPDAEVLVYKCKLSGKMMMQVIELPDLPSGQVYEVWAQEDNRDDQLIGQLIPPIRYDSIYVLDAALNCSALQITSVDPLLNISEPVCLATVKK